MKLTTILCAAAALSLAQSRATPDWEKAAGGKMAFEVASVKPAKTFSPPNFPLDPGDAYSNTGSRFHAVFTLQTYLTFAYKLSLTREQRESMFATQLKWVAEDLFAIDAKSPVENPTKDQMRLMMQSLLADRFQLAVHFETHEVPIFALTLAKPGKLGPKLIPHKNGPACDAAPPEGVFPNRCDVMALMMRGGVSTAGSRNNPLAYICGALPGLGRLSRPVVDRTGLDGRFDFTLEFAPEPNGDAPPNPTAASDPPPAPTFLEALHDQLGLKLEATRGRVETLVVDRIERPSEN